MKICVYFQAVGGDACIVSSVLSKIDLEEGRKEREEM